MTNFWRVRASTKFLNKLYATGKIFGAGERGQACDEEPSYHTEPKLTVNDENGLGGLWIVLTDSAKYLPRARGRGGEGEREGGEARGRQTDRQTHR